MTVLTVDEVNAFLPVDKGAGVSTTSEFASLEKVGLELIISRLASRYNTTEWRDEPPALIRTLLSMYVASRIYSRYFSDDTGETPAYSRELYSEWERYIERLLIGAVVMEDEPYFFERAGVYESEPVFGMGDIF